MYLVQTADNVFVELTEIRGVFATTSEGVNILHLMFKGCANEDSLMVNHKYRMSFIHSIISNNQNPSQSVERAIKSMEKRPDAK